MHDDLLEMMTHLIKKTLQTSSECLAINVALKLIKDRFEDARWMNLLVGMLSAGVLSLTDNQL